MSNTILRLLPIMVTFFAMGAVDFVGIATNYVKQDFMLSDTIANLFTSMVFFWFLIFSVPTGILMNKIGRRKTVILSLWITVVALAIPFLGYNLFIILLSFSLLGIGNTIMQVSLNPLLSNIVSKERLSSALTFGQFVKACASFVAPILAGWSMIQFGTWQILFPFFLIVSLIAIFMLSREQIEEDEIGQPASFRECFSLLGKLPILLCFLGIICHVGIDVGSNVSIPKIMMQKLTIPLETAGIATSIYFLFRTIGSLSGSYLLTKMSTRKFFSISVVMMFCAMLGLFLFDSKTALYTCIAFIGYGNANIFPIVFAQAMQIMPTKKNEVSGLMVMGVFGGTVFPLIMGFVSDMVQSQMGNIAVMLCGIAYLIFLSRKIDQ
ncbi:MAG: MFS transporter [Alphaproteobacteria bacterium]|nr:MFS transporter [Alphaproteobacteria bacterium]